MKTFSKYMIGFVVVVGLVVLVGGGAVALAAKGRMFQRGDFGPGLGPPGPAFGGEFMRGNGPGGDFFARGPRGNGLGGEVTAVSDTSLTVQTPKDESVTVTVDDDTRVMLAESQSEGSLSDVTVGIEVLVRGEKNEAGSITAAVVVVAPAGDRAGGRVTGVEGQTISVENPKEGEATIVVDENTEFRLGRDGAGSLEDVAEGKFVMAFGETQEDGPVKARLVFIAERPEPGERPGHGGRR